MEIRIGVLLNNDAVARYLIKELKRVGFGNKHLVAIVNEMKSQLEEITICSICGKSQCDRG